MKNNIIVALIVGALVLGFVCGLTVSKGNASLEQSIGELVGKVAVLEQKVEQFQNPSVEIEAEFIDPATLLQGGKPQAVGTSVDPSSWTVAKKAEDTEQPQATGHSVDPSQWKAAENAQDSEHAQASGHSVDPTTWKTNIPSIDKPQASGHSVDPTKWKVGGELYRTDEVRTKRLVLLNENGTPVVNITASSSGGAGFLTFQGTQCRAKIQATFMGDQATLRLIGPSDDSVSLEVDEVCASVQAKSLGFTARLESSSREGLRSPPQLIVEEKDGITRVMPTHLTTTLIGTGRQLFLGFPGAEAGFLSILGYGGQQDRFPKK